MVEMEGGKVGYQMPNGDTYTSPSSAGSSITGKACNGWAFWHVDGAEPVAKAAKAEKKAEKPAAEKPKKAAKATEKSAIIRVPNQKGAPEGQTRWHCHDCGKSFFAPTGTVPESCPLPH